VQVFTDLDQVPEGFGPSVVTIGNFDGVHRGHQAVLGRIVELARADGHMAVAVTFDPHPREIINPGISGIKLLSTLQERSELLADLGLDEMIVIPFDRDFSLMTSEDFVRKII
jgi:riboflavin kinase/FMN adenylyltransferase